MSFSGNLYATDSGEDLTTKGDLHGFSTINDRFPIGVNNQVLTADSTQSFGIKWAATAGGAEDHTFTTTETWNPTSQTGVMEVMIDARGITGGKIVVTVDGSIVETISTAIISNRIYNPSSSISIQSAAGAFGLSNTFTYGSTQVPAGNLVTCNLGDSGTKMYLASNSASDNQALYQYTLSTPYDVSTASYASKTYPDPTSNDIRGCSFKSDGTQWYRGSDQSGFKALAEFTMSTPWDISTSATNGSLSVSSYQTGVKDAIIGDSGNQITSLADNASINTYDLSTPYDVSTGSDTAKDAILSGIDNAPRSHAWNSDGTKCFYLGSQNDKVYQLDCSTPWDITSYSHNAANDLDLSSETGDPYGLWVKQEVTPTQFYVGSTASPYNIFQYGESAFAGTVYATVGQ